LGAVADGAACVVLAGAGAAAACVVWCRRRAGVVMPWGVAAGLAVAATGVADLPLPLTAGGDDADYQESGNCEKDNAPLTGFSCAAVAQEAAEAASCG